MADRQLKLPFSTKPVKRIAPTWLRAAAKPPMLAAGNKEIAGEVATPHPALHAGRVHSGARAQSESK